WFQSMNSLFLIVFAPIFAWLWIRMAKAGQEPSTPAKFSFGLILVGAGFAILIWAARMAEQGVQVSPMWLTVTYLLHTWGELSLSPVGLSAMTKLAPVRIGGLMMGVWFLATSVGNFIAGRISGFYESLALPMLFGAVGFFAIAAGLLLFVFVKPIKRLMGEVDQRGAGGVPAEAQIHRDARTRRRSEDRGGAREEGAGQGPLLLRAEAPRQPPPLRLPPRIQGRAAVVGGAQGAIARSEDEAARDARRRSSDRVRHLRRRHPLGLRRR